MFWRIRNESDCPQGDGAAYSGSRVGISRLDLVQRKLRIGMRAFRAFVARYSADAVSQAQSLLSVAQHRIYRA